MKNKEIGQWQKVKTQSITTVALSMALLLFICSWTVPNESKRPKDISVNNLVVVAKDSIDKNTGLIVAPGHQLVVKNCLKCHSPQLITAKRATREGWVATIRWMQHNQGLWDLGKEEPVILDYLAKNYAPTYEGRRPPLKKIEWYKLEK